MSWQRDYLSWKFWPWQSISEYSWIVSLNLRWCFQEKSDVDQLNNLKGLREFCHPVTTSFAWLGFINPKVAKQHENSFLCRPPPLQHLRNPLNSFQLYTLPLPTPLWLLVKPIFKLFLFFLADISSASNIIFSNGDLDPWRPGGVCLYHHQNRMKIILTMCFFTIKNFP